LILDIDLTFACLREAASAKAGILNFDIALPSSGISSKFFPSGLSEQVFSS
jgi:hypothetical protein